MRHIHCVTGVIYDYDLRNLERYRCFEYSLCAIRDSQVMATIALVSFCAGWKMGLDTILSL